MLAPASEPETSETIAPVRLFRWHPKGALEPAADITAREEPLEIRVRGRSVAVTMRTPGNDRQLAAGFLFTEGIISRPHDIIEIAPCLQSEQPENVLNVFLAPALEVDFDRLTRHVFASSSCGVCGKASIEAVRQNFPPVRSGPLVSAGTLAQLPRQMRNGQHIFRRTGGLHAAAVFNLRGELLALFEDIGRHNAVDKVLGDAFLNDKLPFDAHILLVSGRASFEIIQKALAAGVPIVCAVSAPSSLAVEFAAQNGQTLIGFLREGSMNVYSHPERIQPAE